MGQNNCKPQPGDLIEIFRLFYQHWALYLGDGYVIHVTDDGSSSRLFSSSSSSHTRAKVKKQLLKNVVGNQKWRVNNKYDRSRTPRPVEEIIRRAEQWIGKEVPYDLLDRNCEHFVTMLRYGEGESAQAKKAVVGGAVGLGAGAGLVGAAAAAGLAAVAAVATPVVAGLSAVVGMALAKVQSRTSYD